MDKNVPSPGKQSEDNSSHNQKIKKKVKEKFGLPFSAWSPILIGALIGVVLRLIFSGDPGFMYAPMDSAFILFVPFAVGAITIYFAETKARRTWSYYISAASVANVLFVIGTMVIMIEGLICVIIILPVFIVIGIFGGLVMGVICRITNWPKHAAYTFILLPLILGGLPSDPYDNQKYGVVERSIIVPVSAEKVWDQLHNVQDIKPGEVDNAWMYRIGVPLPISGVTQATPDGLVRKIKMGKLIHFDQISTDWEVNKYVKWRYHFYDDSFPPRALDDHVKIGGHYFDIIDTEYRLTQKNTQSTELSIRMNYRVSTQFNWYSNRIAQLLIGNFEDVILDFYSHRSAEMAIR